jgi:L-amino acid N-acyltransferase YncA
VAAESPLDAEKERSMGTLRTTGLSWKRVGRPSSPNALPEPAVLPAKSEHAYYRKLIYLKNDKRVMVRFLNGGDRQDLISLFQEAPDEDLRFFKHDLKNLRLLNHWLDYINYQRLLPLVAVDLENNHLVAAVTLLRGKHSAKHIGEIKIFISKPFRNLGLGSRLLDELIHLATQENLHWLKAEVVADQKHMIQAMRSKGFQTRATLEDFFISKDGVTHDVAMMMRPIMDLAKEF